jgi:hypothetical protein
MTMDEDKFFRILIIVIDVLFAALIGFIAKVGTEIVCTHIIHKPLGFHTGYIFLGAFLFLLIPVPTKKYNSL